MPMQNRSLIYFKYGTEASIIPLRFLAFESKMRDLVFSQINTGKPVLDQSFTLQGTANNIYINKIDFKYIRFSFTI